jgi:hypothetical protein
MVAEDVSLCDLVPDKAALGQIAHHPASPAKIVGVAELGFGLVP